LSSGAATPVPIDPSMGTPVGITNAKIRLYARETDSKWRDMGSARLTIMLPPRPRQFDPSNPNPNGLAKRVFICDKSKGGVLLDVTLFENSFERVQRTGIAVTVWEELRGPNGEVGRAAATGGVSSSRTKTYLIQMKSVSNITIDYDRQRILTDAVTGTRSCIYFQHGWQTTLLALYIHLSVYGRRSDLNWASARCERPRDRCMIYGKTLFCLNCWRLPIPSG
jgi:hypothetical protein